MRAIEFGGTIMQGGQIDCRLKSSRAFRLGSIFESSSCGSHPG